MTNFRYSRNPRMARRRVAPRPRLANRKRASEQNPIDNIDVVDVGGGHAQIHVKSGNLTVFTIYERYNTENYYVMQIERLRNRTSSGIGSYLIDPTEFPYLWEFTHFHNGTGELVPDYLLDEMADELESIWQSSEFSGVTSSRRALPHRQSSRLSNRRRPNPARHRANRKTANTYFIHDVDFPTDLVDEGDIEDWAEDEFRGWFTDVDATYAYGSLNLHVTDGNGSLDSAISSGDIDARNVEKLDENGDYRPVSSTRRANRRRPHSARHRANRRYSTINKTSLVSSEFSGMGWTNGHTGLVGHFVAYDNWLWDMVRIGTISGPKELEREFMGGRARELENMSDIDWSQVDWNDVYNFLSGK